MTLLIGGYLKNGMIVKVAAKVTSEVYPLPMKIETLSLGFDDLTSNSAVLGIMWADVYVPVKFEVPTDEEKYLPLLIGQ